MKQVACILPLMALGVLLLLLVGCGPSCKERGGNLVYSHTTFIYGKGTMTPVTHYRCRGAKDD